MARWEILCSDTNRITLNFLARHAREEVFSFNNLNWADSTVSTTVGVTVYFTFRFRYDETKLFILVGTENRHKQFRHLEGKHNKHGGLNLHGDLFVLTLSWRDEFPLCVCVLHT